MDCNMPIVDGYEATKSIRSFVYSEGLAQPLIISVTGHTEDEYIQKALQSGMNELSPKPIDLALFRDVLKKLDFIR